MAAIYALYPAITQGLPWYFTLAVAMLVMVESMKQWGISEIRGKSNKGLQFTPSVCGDFIISLVYLSPFGPTTFRP